jgi:hypothetical protein
VGNLQDTDRTLAAAVALTLDALKLAPEDAAAKRLAQKYAAAIDAAEQSQDALDKLGPKLLATLESLGATPAARARLKEGSAQGGKPNRLAQLRAARPA